MEKFAIDLDKVLDDFELDEDENEASSQYDKLQLEFCESHNGACADSMHGNFEATGNNWLASVSEVLPGTRSPPDGQHDDNSVSDLSTVNSSAMNKLEDNLLCDLTTEPMKDNSALLSNSQEKSNDYSAILSNDLLWPQFSSGNLDVCGAAGIANMAASNSNPYLIPENASDGRKLSDSSRLDVLPVDFAPPPNSNQNQEPKHPDIIDVNQSSTSHRECRIQEAVEQCGINIEGQQKPTDLVSSTQHDNVLLPDLMFSNNACLPEQSNPAVVTENLLSCGLMEPAIIQESQSAHKLPEVTNVHQSADLQFKNRDGSAKQELLDFPDRIINQSASLEEQSMPVEIVSEAIKPYEPPKLPDVSIDCAKNISKIVDESRRDINPVRFDPDLQVDEVELAAGISELEAELDACPVLKICNPESSANIASSLLHGESHLDSVEPVGHYKESRAMAEPSSGDHSESSLSQFSKYQLQPTETSDIPSINTLEACAPSSETLPRDIEDKSFAPISSTEAIEESSSGSSATDTTSSSSTLMGDFDQSDNVPFSIPASSQQDSQNNDQSDGTDPLLDQAPLDGAEQPAVEDDGSAFEPTETNPAVGTVAPFWVPDKDAANCQECGTKFTIIRRRHHCRACGRVLCSFCCHSKASLPYLDYKEERVCETCLLLLTEAISPDEGELAEGQSSRQPNPNNPMEYCSRIPPPQQAAASAAATGIAPPPTVMVPVGILKRDHANYRGANSGRSRANKQVIFMDGIQPGGDLREMGNPTQQPVSTLRRGDRSSRLVISALPESSSKRGSRRAGKVSVSPDRCLIPEGGGLPPVLLSLPYDGEYKFDHSPDTQKLEEQLQGDGPPVVFAVMKNFTVLVKKIKLTCCIGMEVWNLATRGLCTVGQDELVVLIEALPEERAPPAQLFTFFYSVYQQANKGNLVTELGHTIFTEPEGFLGSRDHAGFLYIKPSFQCLNKLLLPPAPYIFAVLIQKWETPWAKVFPLRLMLRLGAEFRYYPCPLVSSRNRKPVFGEIGHTIMNLLVDFRNYSFTIPLIQGFTIHMEDKKTTLLIPRNRYEQVCKALDNSNDHVLALAANFSPQADSHLVTVEDDDGNYSTQAINIHNRPRKVTGASFIVFNGALKTTSGLKGKSSIVEDGLMVQIHGDMMTSLRDALRNLNDFDVHCGQTSSTDPEEVVFIRWIEDDKSFNVGIRSAVDDKAMDGVPSIKVHSVPDYASKYHIIRWTEIFIIQEENANGNSDINISRLSEALSRACCIALIPHLHELFATGQTKVALRTTLHQENVEYEIGSGGVRLPPSFMNSLDTELIPVIHQSAASITDQPIILELVFHILEQ